MLFSNLAHKSGFLSADDIAMLRGVFDEAIALEPSLDDADKEHLASKLIVMFERGIQDRQMLLNTVLPGYFGKRSA